MTSVTQLLAAHGSILLLDAVSLRVQTGLLRTGLAASWIRSEEEAGRSLFKGTAAILKQAGLELDAVGAFVYCDGPGSMLGTRTAAMALRTWLTLRSRPVFAYSSLTLAGMAEWRRSPRAFTVLADARRETWHTQQVSADGALGPLQRLPIADLPAGELLSPTFFRAWSKSPTGIRECSYDAADLAGLVADAPILRPVTAPDVFQHEAPVYKKWSAQPHSAETATAQ